MNRSLLLVVCDFLLLSILALARFDVPKDAVIAQDGQKVVSKEVVERISDGENYDDVVAEPNGPIRYLDSVSRFLYRFLVKGCRWFPFFHLVDKCDLLLVGKVVLP